LLAAAIGSDVAKKIRICLSTSQWEELELHLAAEYVFTRSTEIGSSNDLDCRTVSDPATYQMLLDTERTHCPHLVPLIEKQK
jgi:hypothetical protein